MTSNDQSIKGLEAAYRAVFNRPLKDRVAELCHRYQPYQWNEISSELNPGNSVPCFWTLTELYDHYELSK